MTSRDAKTGRFVKKATTKKAVKAVKIVCTESGNGADEVIVRAPNVYPVF